MELHYNIWITIVDIGDTLVEKQVAFNNLGVYKRWYAYYNHLGVVCNVIEIRMNVLNFLKFNLLRFS